MKILMITDFYPPALGGLETATRNLSVALADRGHDVHVATIQTDGLPSYDEDGAVHVHRIRCTTQRLPMLFSQRRPWSPPLPDPEATASLARVSRDIRPDVVHGHDWLARSFLPLKPALRVPLVMSLHYYTLSCAKKNLMYKAAQCSGPKLVKCIRCGSVHYGNAKGPAVVIANFALAAAERAAVDIFLPVSVATAAGNGLIGSSYSYEVVPNIVLDPPSLSTQSRLLIDQLPAGEFVLFVGDLRKDKGIEVLLEAYGALSAPPPLVLIGKVWRETPALPREVTLLTDWPNEAVREAQRRCLTLVAPSIWSEPFGLVVPEAMSAGRPVIASNVGGLRDLVEDGVNGLLVPPGNSRALSAALARLIANSDLRDELGRNAARAARRFRGEQVVPRFERIYERLVAASLGSSREA